MNIKMKHYFAMLRDVIITDLIYLLPSLLRWFYHRKIKKDIVYFGLLDKQSGKRGSLYQHGEWKSDNKKPCITLILHGLYAHPFVMQHLAKMAQEVNNGPVFSLYVRYDLVNPENHRILIKQAIDNIEKICGSSHKGIILVGHSMGAVESAYMAFGENNPKILSVISIAGRLKGGKHVIGPPIELLEATLDKVYQGIQSHPDLPLYQIIGRYDWIVPMEASLVRKKQGYYHIVESMHFNILFHNDMNHFLPEYLSRN